MIVKSIKYITILFVIFLIIVLLLNYYILQPIEYKELVCHKGSLLQKIGEDGNVYTRVKGLSCEYDKGMLIIEEQL